MVALPGSKCSQVESCNQKSPTCTTTSQRCRSARFKRRSEGVIVVVDVAYHQRSAYCIIRDSGIVKPRPFGRERPTKVSERALGDGYSTTSHGFTLHRR